MSYLMRQLRMPLPEIVRRYLPDGDNRVDRWTPPQLGAYQRDALRAMLVHAYDGSPFYRERFQGAGVDPRALDLPRELPRVPALDKDAIRGHPWILLAVPRQSVSQVHVSTGTTGGEEIYVPHTWEDLYIRAMAPAMRQLVPVGIDDVVLNALPYEMSAAGLAFHRTFQRACGALVLAAGKGGHYSTPALALAMARDLRATVVITTPSYAMLLAETAAEEGTDLGALPLRFLWLTGEGCSPAFRTRVERAWGHPALFYYGSLEAGPIGVECAERAGYHVAAGHVYVEVLDVATGAPVAPGEVGEVVVTELTRFAAPLIRYRTQDLGYVDAEPCACGVSLPRLFLRGRAGDQLRIGGVTLSPYLVEEALMSVAEVGDWYELVETPRALVVRIEPARGVVPSQALRESVRSRVEYVTGVDVEVHFAEIARPGGKVTRVVREAACHS